MLKFKEFVGYTLGGLMFVLLIPMVMWWVSGTPCVLAVPLWRLLVAVVLSLLGLSLSIWSIVYMRRKGDGNPMDAFGHERFLINLLKYKQIIILYISEKYFK